MGERALVSEWPAVSVRLGSQVKGPRQHEGSVVDLDTVLLAKRLAFSPGEFRT